MEPAKARQVFVFFDGVCNLCNLTVDFLIRTDKQDIFRYGPLQGKTAHKLLPPKLILPLSTLVVYDTQTKMIYTESDGALYIARFLGLPYSLVGWGHFIPKALRDAIYRWVSRHRYQLFGQRTTCRLPNEKERSLFLD